MELLPIVVDMSLHIGTRPKLV